MRRVNFFAAAVLAGAAMALVVTSVSADAGQRTRSGAFVGKRGRNVTYSQSRSHANGVATNQRTYTGPNGKTATTTVTKTPQGNGTVAVQGTMTGPNGNTYSRSSTVTH